MSKSHVVERLLPLFREYMGLEKRRGDQGVTPPEFQRWLDLKRILGKHFQKGPDREQRQSPRVETRMRVEFKSAEHFRDATIKNLSRGGVFVATPFAAEVGTELILRIHIRATGEDLEVPGVVVSNNIADDQTTSNLGMGVRFGNLSDEQRASLDALYERVVEQGVDCD
jgi:uncharacterized protein (TIGR02266 family)